jgi:hypothetical protein
MLSICPTLVARTQPKRLRNNELATLNGGTSNAFSCARAGRAGRRPCSPRCSDNAANCTERVSRLNPSTLPECSSLPLWRPPL